MAGNDMGTVVVVGRVGAGKSELVGKLVLNGDKRRSGGLPEVSSGLGPCTRKAAAYIFPGARRISQCRLIDTKGFVGCKQEDAEAIRDLAKKVDKLNTIVGVVYVLSDKMDPSERRICDFLFNTLFHDVPASRTLVVRTKVANLGTYDAESEREYLEEQGNIPGKILDASWVAIDLHPSVYGTQTIVENVLKLFSSWQTTLQLSNKLDAALEYLSGGHHVAEENELSLGASAQTNDQTKRIDLVERRINGATSQTQEQRKKMELMEERLNAAIMQIEAQKQKTDVMEQRFEGVISQLQGQEKVEGKSEGQIVEVHNPYLKEHQDQAQNLEQQPGVKPSSSQVGQDTQRQLMEMEAQNAEDAVRWAQTAHAIDQSHMAMLMARKIAAGVTAQVHTRWY